MQVILIELEITLLILSIQVVSKPVIFRTIEIRQIHAIRFSGNSLSKPIPIGGKALQEKTGDV